MYLRFLAPPPLCIFTLRHLSICIPISQTCKTKFGNPNSIVEILSICTWISRFCNSYSQARSNLHLKQFWTSDSVNFTVFGNSKITLDCVLLCYNVCKRFVAMKYNNWPYILSSLKEPRLTYIYQSFIAII